MPSRISSLPDLRAIALAGLVSLSPLALGQPAFAAGNHDHGAGHNDGGHHNGGHHSVDIGSPGSPEAVDRTVTIIMTDNSYDPASLSLKEGETVRFIVENRGEFVHEFNIGTAAMHAAHQAEMMQMMESGALEADRINHAKMGNGSGMAHDDPNSVLLEPGQTGEIIWTFATHATLEFACNVPGHYQTGMKGKIRLSH